MADASSATLVRREAALGGRASGDEAEGTTSAAPTEDRLIKAASLLAWVESEGATVSSVSAASSSGAGVGLYAARDVQIGEEAFRCPCKLALTADAAAADPLIGGPLRELRVDEEHSILLMLLHCARLGRTSYWSAYVDALPTEDELVPLLPAFWPHSELELLLGGTPLLAQARAAHAALCEFHESVVIGQLSKRFPEVFPPDYFSFKRLCWAHAVYQSRAIRLPLPGGARPSLVPLLDLMNHSTGLPSTVSYAYANGSGSGDDARTAATASFVLVCGRSTLAGEELMLNYGAKSNGELLRCHGFVSAENPADVCELDLSMLRPDGISTPATTRLAMLSDALLAAGKRSIHDAPLSRHFLTVGPLLGASLLGASRVICAEEGSELRRAIANVTGAEAEDEKEDGNDHFDWSLVDWSAEDPFAVANAAVQGRPPCGVPCERRMLSALERLIHERTAALPASPADAEERGGDERGQQRRAAAHVYVDGLRTILAGAAREVTRLLEATKVDGEALEEAPAAAQSKRARHSRGIV